MTLSTHLSTSVFILLSIVIITLLTIRPSTYHIELHALTLDQSSSNDKSSNKTCIEFQPNQLAAQRIHFDIGYNQIISNCYRPQRDSDDLTSKLNFMWRAQWVLSSSHTSRIVIVMRFADGQRSIDEDAQHRTSSESTKSIDLSSSTVHHPCNQSMDSDNDPM